MNDRPRMTSSHAQFNTNKGAGLKRSGIGAQDLRPAASPGASPPTGERPAPVPRHGPVPRPVRSKEMWDIAHTTVTSFVQRSAPVHIGMSDLNDAMHAYCFDRFNQLGVRRRSTGDATVRYVFFKLRSKVRRADKRLAGLSEEPICLTSKQAQELAQTICEGILEQVVARHTPAPEPIPAPSKRDKARKPSKPPYLNYSIGMVA